MFNFLGNKKKLLLKRCFFSPNNKNSNNNNDNNCFCFVGSESQTSSSSGLKPNEFTTSENVFCSCKLYIKKDKKKNPEQKPRKRELTVVFTHRSLKKKSDTEEIKEQTKKRKDLWDLTFKKRPSIIHLNPITVPFLRRRSWRNVCCCEAKKNLKKIGTRVLGL